MCAEANVPRDVKAIDLWLSRGRPHQGVANDTMGAGPFVCGQSGAALGFPAADEGAAESMALCSRTIGAHTPEAYMDKKPVLSRRRRAIRTSALSKQLAGPLVRRSGGSISMG